jgi:predicted flap endonuclease-1-like 5' DNA nuclease
MLHYLIELAVWTLLAYFVGCCIGCLLRQIFGTESAALTAGGAPDVAVPAAATPAEQSHGQLARPRGIAAARSGKSDNLQRLSGVGPKNEKILHSLGIFHFDQIAGWSAAEVNWVDDHLKFNGRIRREEWVNQARLLAEGNEEEFAKLYGNGGVSGPRAKKT